MQSVGLLAHKANVVKKGTMIFIKYLSKFFANIESGGINRRVNMQLCSTADKSAGVSLKGLLYGLTHPCCSEGQEAL